MDEMRPVLERMRDSLTPAADPEALERLRHRRDRRATRRRVTAALTAIAITAAGTGVLIRTFDGRDEQIATPSPLPAAEPHTTATIPVGTRGQVSAITAGFGSVWVAAYGVPGGEGVDQDAILRLDPATNQVSDVIPVDTVPSWETGGGGLTSGFGSLWVAGGAKIDGQAQTVLLRIDPTTLTVVSRIALGGDYGTGDVDVNSTGVWVVGPTHDGSALVRVDPTSERVTARIPLRGQAARHVVATDDAVIVQELEWAGGGGPCSVTASVDPTDGHLRAEEPAPGACAGGGEPFEWDGSVWDATADGFAQVDPATALPVPPTTPYIDDGFPRADVAVDASGVWFGAYPGGNGSAPDTLSRFDPDTGHIETFPMDVGWSAAAVLDGSIWAMGWEGTVTRIDLFDQAESESPPTSSGLRVEDVFRFSPDDVGALQQVVTDGDSVWVLDGGASDPALPAAVLRLDPATGRIISRTEVPGANDLTVLGDSIWVVRHADGGGGWVTQVDRGSGVILGSIPLPAGSYGGPILAYQGDLWVSAEVSIGSGFGVRLEVLRIDPKDRKISAEIPAEVCTLFQACYPQELIGAGGAVWAAGSERGVTIRIDAATDTTSKFDTGAVAGFAADARAVWVAVQPADEPVSAARWWDGSLELLPLDPATGHRRGGPIPLIPRTQPALVHAGVPFAATDEAVFVWGVDTGGSHIGIGRVDPRTGEVTDATSIPGEFLDAGRAVLDQARGVIWVVGSYELTKILL